MPPYSLYLHIPFCIHRCAYCDFNTYSGLEGLIPDYVTALLREIELVGRRANQVIRLHTVFFGGGTPSLLPAAAVARIIEAVSNYFDLDGDAEITLEANPGTVRPEHLNALRDSGVNRISLGMQSAIPNELRLLERQHDYADVRQAVDWSRQAGIDNLNLDLIFGLPHQALSDWKYTLSQALRLAPEHLSLYALSLEHGTPMQKWVDRGLLVQPEADLAADMYEWAMEYLEAAGYQQYEISNWARPDAQGNPRTCRHNLQYWHLEPYLGLGAGAHGYVSGVHTVNVLSPASYIKRLLEASGQEENTQGDLAAECAHLSTPATQSINIVPAEDQMGEFMMMGLRLTQEGVSNAAFQLRFHHDLAKVYKAQINKFVSFGLLEWDGNILRLTPKGRLLGNQVFMEFI
jgi:oxygen-independent coproporphyrinogen-3 oxidase